MTGNSEMLTHLGKESRIPASPAEAVLDKVPAPSPGHLYLVRFTCPEFTTLCPITGQPDFAHLVLDYAPRERIIESKSFKLFLASFRNQGIFHEAATTEIATRLVRELEPRWLRLCAFWYPRGGMPVDVFFQTAAPPVGLYVPDPGISPYRGR